jgi:hypothetical protein
LHGWERALCFFLPRKKQRKKEVLHMKCLACSGRVAMLQGAKGFDTLGVCVECGGVLLKDKTDKLVKEWCICSKEVGEGEIYFWQECGGHGWLHLVCGQITQTG